MKLIKILLFSFLVLFPFGQLTRLPIPFKQIPEVNVYLSDLVLGGLVITWLILKLFKRKKISLPYLAKPIFLFIALAGLSLVVNITRLTSKELLVSSLYWVRWIIFTGLYFLIVDLKKEFKELKKDFLKNVLLIWGVTIAVFGLVQYIIWPDLRPLAAIGWDPHYYRVASSFFDPGFTGLFLVLAFIILVDKFVKFSKKEWLKSRKIIVFLGIALYLALALTYSRTTYLAFNVGMGILAWANKKPKIFVVALGLMMMTLLFLPRPPGEGGKLSRTYSIEARIRSWQNSFIIAIDHPILGVGFNAYRYAQRDYRFLTREKWQLNHSGAGGDSSLIFVFATTGVLGLGAYLWLWFKSVTFENNLAKRSVFLASSAAIFIHGFFLNSFFIPG